MAELTHEFRSFLLDSGASLCGFGDVSQVVAGDLHTGVSIALAIPASVLETIHDGPSRAYFEAYHSLNERLDALAAAGAEFLTDRGYRAHAQTRANVKELPGYHTELPHKTVATRAGLGWIGKSALLVTREFGPAIRLSSLVTDAPLETGEPVNHSLCGSCTACMDHCPGKAISGILWNVAMVREEFFDAFACRKAARALSASHLNEEITLCGKCIEICPYTERYMYGPESSAR